GLSARRDRLASPAGRLRAEAGNAVFRLRLSVLAIPRRKTPVRAARRLRPIDLRRSRREARDGDHGGGEERKRRQGAVGAGTRCALARLRRSLRYVVNSG